MLLQEIIDMWREDGKIDQSELGNELERSYTLHSKYIDMLSKEKLILKGYEYEYKRKKLEAFEDYSQGPGKGSIRSPPAVGRVLRQDTPMYCDADEQLQQLSAKIDLVQAKIDVLESIVNMVVYRNNSIGNLISWTKYVGGG